MSAGYMYRVVLKTVQLQRMPLLTWRNVPSRFPDVRGSAKKRRNKQSYQGFSQDSPSTPTESLLEKQQNFSVRQQPPDTETGAERKISQDQSFSTTNATESTSSSAVPSAKDIPEPAVFKSNSITSLPAVSRERVITACLQVSGIIAAVGLLIRIAAPDISTVIDNGQEESVMALLQWPPGMAISQLGWSLAVAGAVTGARIMVMQLWPEFREATNTSNKQVLTPLQPLDLLVVAALPGVAEELLFRGALIPAISPDWKGVAIAGATFGFLHNNGGRNPAFALWASLVGCAYGFLFITTQNLYTAMLAHSLANLASGVLWLQSNGAEEV